MNAGKRLLKRLVPRRWQPPAVAAAMRRRWERSPVVRTGPFAGLTFTWRDWDPRYSAPFPKCMGTYELELHAVMERLIARAPGRIVEVGAADGYYAAGFARRLPATEIIAFEELAAGRAVLTEVARANGVEDRIALLGRCEPPDLARVLGTETETVLMLDVEGYEAVLLDPERVPALRTTTVLVECHDRGDGSMAASLRARFHATHRATSFHNRPRTLGDLPPVPAWVKRYVPHQMLGWANERVGGPMVWLLLEPLSGAAGCRSEPATARRVDQ